MTSERIQLLKAVNFQWKLLEDWNDRFRELEKYAMKHGDTLVPQQYGPNPSLGIWVRNQRTQYKLYMEGKPSKLLPERIKMLKAVNFEWNAYDAKWMASFVALGKHMRQHGLGTLPSYQCNRSLRNWVEEQRKQYRRLHGQSGQSPSTLSGDTGEKESAAPVASASATTSRLTPKRIELLDLIGFPWTSMDE